MRVLPPDAASIRFAAQALRNGELIGLPTETVYGIGASALNAEAIQRTFDLKERPSDNPLIVHVTSLAAAGPLVTRIPDAAHKLAAAFWPGPLTLVLPKSALVPNIATAGLDTVAIRVPRLPVALKILAEAGVPVTAPSANPFMALSPTRVEDISPSILTGLACVIDGGPCEVGVESTVVDCSRTEIAILRPGGITRREIQSVLGFEVGSQSDGKRRSPGMYRRHYSPRTPLRLVDRLGPDDAGICFDEPRNPDQIQLPRDPRQFAQLLYATLHRLDQASPNEILIQIPPDTPEWEAVWDRVLRAQGKNS